MIITVVGGILLIGIKNEHEVFMYGLGTVSKNKDILIGIKEPISDNTISNS